MVYYTCIVVCFLQFVKRIPKTSKKKGLISVMIRGHFYTNIDVNSVTVPFLNRHLFDRPVTRETLYPFVDVYRDSAITDVVLNIYAQHSVTDSRVFSDYAAKYEQTVENGEPVDYFPYFASFYAFNKRYHLDPYAVWIGRVRENGQSPWISVRMNDCHDPEKKTSFLRPDFFYEAREKGYMIGEKYGYFRNCLNYAFPEVREKMLAYLREQLMRYDVDGIELDFMREIFCFDYLSFSGVAIMNDFMRAVRSLVTEQETRRGHAIRIGVRLCRDAAQALAFGMDAETWAKEKLVDLITVTPRWESCDSHMPVDEWKKLCPGVEIAAGLEVSAIPERFAEPWRHLHFVTPAIARGYAAHYLASGADSVYLFNYFLDPDNVNPDFVAVNDTCFPLAAACSHPLRYMATYQDLCPDGYAPFSLFPAVLSGKDVSVPVALGTLCADQYAELLFGLSEGTSDDVTVLLDGKPLTGFVPCEHGAVESDRAPFVRSGAALYRKEITIPESGAFTVTFTLAGKTPATICYMEACRFFQPRA